MTWKSISDFGFKGLNDIPALQTSQFLSISYIFWGAKVRILSM